MILKVQRFNILAVFIFFVVSADINGADTTKVLFIGNSYTYYNDLPGLFGSLAQSGGNVVFTDNSTQGGFTLENHFTYQQTIDKINSNDWNYVILQEQSQYPVIPYYQDNSFLIYGRKLDSLIKLRNSNAVTMLYMTWGRKYGGQQCIGGYCSPVFTDYHHMQDSLAASYYRLQGIIQSKITPVGIAWKRAMLQNPNVNLWDSDNSHPALGGSYLAACMFYTFIFNANPQGLQFYGGLTVQDAQFYQAIAGTFMPIGIVKVNNFVPSSFKIYNNYPNPFNPSTKIRFDIPSGVNDNIKIEIFDELGKEIEIIVNEHLNSGSYEITWNAEKYPSGLYFYKISAGEFSETKKMILVK